MKGLLHSGKDLVPVGDWAPLVPREPPRSCTITAMNPLSGVLDEAWRMYKAHAGHLLAIAFVIYLVAAVIAALLALAGTIGALLGGLVGIIAAFLLQAAAAGTCSPR